MRKIAIILLLAISSMTSAQISKQLNEVTVIGSLTFLNSDGYTVNLHKTDIVKGKTASDILGFLPNISKEDDNYKINGLPVSEFYINGVLQKDPAELKNISADMIDKVQITYLTGANQKSTLSGGTIRITLKKPKANGYYGNVTLGTDWHRSCDFGNNNGSGVVYYRHNGLSIYNNLYLGYEKTKTEADQWFFDINNLPYQTREAELIKGYRIRNRISLTQSFRSGLQIGGSYMIHASCPKQHTRSIASDGCSEMKKDGKSLEQEGTLKANAPLGKSGGNIEGTADWYYRDHHDDYSYLQDGTISGYTNLVNKTNQWKIKTDITYPINAGIIARMGASIQYIESKNIPNSHTTDASYSDNSATTQTKGLTPIVYGEIKGKLKKIRYNVGMTWQSNHIRCIGDNNGPKSENTQQQFCPSLQVMIPFGMKSEHALMVNYKKTISDIPYSAINKTIVWEDSHNYHVGNMSLHSPTADLLMASLSLFRSKLNLTAIFAHSRNRIYWQTIKDTDRPNTYYKTPINIEGQNSWGIGAEWMESPVKWWRFKLAGRLEIRPEDIHIGNIHYDKTHLKEYFYFNNSFIFTNQWGGMLNMSTEPTFHTLDRTYHGVYRIGGQVHKNLYKDHLQLSLNFTVLAKQRKTSRNIPDCTIVYANTTPPQYVAISATWKFTSKKKVKVDVTQGIQNYLETKDDL